MKEIKFRGVAINGDFVYGLLTKKKIRHNGTISYAIATGDCSLANTVPVVEDSVVQLCGYDSKGNELYEGDIVKDSAGNVYTVSLEGAVNGDDTRFLDDSTYNYFKK